MNKITTYFLTFCLFFGLSILLSSHKKLPSFSKINSQLQQLISGNNGNIILRDVYKTGVILKSYFIKIEVYDEVKTPVTFIFSIAKEDWLKMKARVDQSLVTIFFDGGVTFAPIPAGLNYVDNPSLGKWVTVQKNQQWHFHRPYQYLIDDFQWRDFRPTITYYQKIKQNGLSELEEKEETEQTTEEISPILNQKTKLVTFLKSLVTLEPLF